VSWRFGQRGSPVGHSQPTAARPSNHSVPGHGVDSHCSLAGSTARRVASRRCVRVASRCVTVVARSHSRPVHVGVPRVMPARATAAGSVERLASRTPCAARMACASLGCVVCSAPRSRVAHCVHLRLERLQEERGCRNAPRPSVSRAIGTGARPSQRTASIRVSGDHARGVSGATRRVHPVVPSPGAEDRFPCGPTSSAPRQWAACFCAGPCLADSTPGYHSAMTRHVEPFSGSQHCYLPRTLDIEGA
jgi:hypothetical protein